MSDQLKSFIERIEAVEAEKSALNDDLKEIYAEAKLVGFDVKAIKQVVRRRKVDKHELQSLDAAIELYEKEIT